MSSEQAWSLLRTVAGVELGEPGYFSAPRLLTEAQRRLVAGGSFSRSTVRTTALMWTAARTLGLTSGGGAR